MKNIFHKRLAAISRIAASRSAGEQMCYSNFAITWRAQV
jgi:hypothetical protein